MGHELCYVDSRPVEPIVIFQSSHDYKDKGSRLTEPLLQLQIKSSGFKVARLDFLRGIPPKFEH